MHRIYIRDESDLEIDEDLIRRTIETALTAQHVDIPCEISVLITDNQGIREINRQYRDIDSPTDVLSFPAFDLIPGDFNPEDGEADMGTGLFPLGDIILSGEKVKAQAEEYGHSLQREVVYLIIHSVLHLLGYDHLDEGEDKLKMRGREKEILAVCLDGLPQ